MTPTKLRVFEYPPGLRPEAWGQLHGSHFQKEIRELAAIRLELCTRIGGFASPDAVLSLADKHVPLLAEFCPELHQELTGIASGAAMSPAEIVVLNHYTDLRDIAASQGKADDGGCSAIWGRVNGHALLGQTWDMHASAAEFVMKLFVPAHDTAEGRAPAAWFTTITGCVGMAGMNAEGVGITINNLRSLDARTGVVWPALVRRALWEHTASAARDVIVDAPLGSGHHYLVADGDEVFGIETSGVHRQIVFDGAEDIFIHTNHCVDARVGQASTVAAGSTTYMRYETLKAGLTDSPLGGIDDLWRRLGTVNAQPGPRQPAHLRHVLGDRHGPHGKAAVGIALGRRVRAQGADVSIMSEHPFFFTWSRQRDVKPLEITGGNGARFVTSDGHEWIDLAALSFQANLGHGHPRMIAAIKAQADRLCLTLPNAVFPEKTRLARELLDLAPPGFTKVFFTLGGSEATENAIKMARLTTGRHKLVSRYRSYHGATMGALTLSGDWRRPPLEPGLAGVVHAMHGTDFGELMDLEGPDTIAAVVLETIPGANGVMLPAAGELQAIRQACTDRGTLLVLDEVLTGFGRTGTWFAYEHFGVEPDIITVAKGLTGGYASLGAVLVHERVARTFDDGILYAGLTAYAHPIACATALEALAVYRDEKLVENAAQLEGAMLGGLRAIAGQHPDIVRDARGKGLLAALELELPDAGWQRLGDALEQRRVATHVRKDSRCLILSPPLCITGDELETGLGAVRESIEEAT